MIGKRIGQRYEVIRSIGDGGMSKVYLAYDVILDREVAIKVLNYEFSNEEEMKRRFHREALSATSLAHPNIVGIFDVGEDGDLHYLVMEYIEGTTLKKFIQEHGPMTPEDALPIMKQIVSAIANAHHNGIVHRDIKPQNILMDAEGNVKITDFGIAMALSATSHTKTNSVIGTVHYLSPEQARGGFATKKSDIYSMGIVFYELLTGELPFSAETAVAIALKHLQEETPSVRDRFPSIPQSVENVILKATAKDPAHRYRSSDEMYDDLLTVLSLDRKNEPKFVVPYDDDQTRAIPVIKDTPQFAEVEKTKTIHPVIVEPVTPSATVEQAPPPGTKKKPFIVASLLGVAALLLALLFIPGILFPKKAMVPDVSGKEVTEAIDILVEAGFKVAEEQKEQYSDEFEEGEVIRTIPDAGKKRDVGTEIVLFVSTGKEKMKLMNYVGSDFDQIKELLDEFGFKSITREEKYSDQPKGTIVKQSPPEGSEVVPSETDIIFTVSKGKEMKQLSNLSGFDEAQLLEYGKTTSFDIQIVGKNYSSTVPAGRVISQEPGAGTQLDKGSIVKVILSKGPEKKPVNYIVKTVTIPYEPIVNPEDGTEQLQPQLVRIYIQDKSHTMADPVEEFTITEDTVKRITIELEEGQRGAYKITRDAKIIAEKSFSYEDAD